MAEEDRFCGQTFPESDVHTESLQVETNSHTWDSMQSVH